MPNPLDTVAKTLAKSAGFVFYDAVLTRDEIPDSPGESFDPATPVPVEYPCKALDTQFSAGLRGQGLVDATDVKVLILKYTLGTDPLPGDRIAVRSFAGSIVPENASGQKAVTIDPAQAMWVCRCKT